MNAINLLALGFPTLGFYLISLGIFVSKQLMSWFALCTNFMIESSHHHWISLDRFSGDVVEDGYLCK